MYLYMYLPYPCRPGHMEDSRRPIIHAPMPPQKPRQRQPKKRPSVVQRTWDGVPNEVTMATLCGNPNSMVFSEMLEIHDIWYFVLLFCLLWEMKNEETVTLLN